MLSHRFVQALGLCSVFSSVLGQGDTMVEVAGNRYTLAPNANGVLEYLADNRRPALYSGNFGDCHGPGSSIQLDRFDVAYYKDNTTIMFHLGGSSRLISESLMLNIEVYAYGLDRFNLPFNPCNTNIASLCPVQRNITIEAGAIIPVSPTDVAGIPAIALSIPDFEGEAILRIFANTTRQEVACYSTVLKNGHSFSQPSSVGTILGVMTLITAFFSIATAMYGDNISAMRTHYAHTLSVGVVFAVFQHIFFTGALSVNWPSVLVAWWSNFAWAGGMINTSTMQSSIDRMTSANVGNISEIGSAGSGTAQTLLGGGVNMATLYRRSLDTIPVNDMIDKIYEPFDFTGGELARDLYKRDLANASTGFVWYGNEVTTGLPLPGNYSGFAGTLATEQIRASNAFLTGFLWFLILLVLVIASIIATKWLLEGLIHIKAVRNDRLVLFRKMWINNTISAALRTCFIAFFMIMFLTMFQFTYDSSAGPKAIAAIVFIIFLVGAIVLSIMALAYRFETIHRGNQLATTTEKANRRESFRLSMRSMFTRSSDDATAKRFSPLWIFHNLNNSGSKPNSIHDDEEYITKFGWIASRFRKSRWWFFSAWLFYEFIRACFYAGASGHALTQVFGLLVVEILAFCLIIWARPFEGQRLNLIVVYLLGFSKVASVALSAAFDVSFNLGRIITTVIGVVIIVIQGILVIVTALAMIIGAFTSYMSLTRERPIEVWRPRRLRTQREKYFRHILLASQERQPDPVAKQVAVTPDLPNGPYFNVSSIRRVNKIEDNDRNSDVPGPHGLPRSMTDQSIGQVMSAPAQSLDLDPRPARRMSTSSSTFTTSNLPYGARSHRPSWSTHDFQQNLSLVDVNRTLPDREHTRSPLATTTITSSIPMIPAGSRHSSGSPAPAKTLRTAKSVESLRAVGIPQHDETTITDVPLPRIRPRSGTWDSRGPSRVGSRSTTPTNANFPDRENLTSTANNVRVPLTPAVENDEEFAPFFDKKENK